MCGDFVERDIENLSRDGDVNIQDVMQAAVMCVVFLSKQGIRKFMFVQESF